MELNTMALRRAMAEKGFTVVGLARAAGVSCPALNGWLNQGRKPRMDTLGKLAKALGVDIYDLAKVAKA